MLLQNTLILLERVTHVLQHIINVDFRGLPRRKYASTHGPLQAHTMHRLQHFTSLHSLLEFHLRFIDVNFVSFLSVMAGHRYVVIILGVKSPWDGVDALVVGDGPLVGVHDFHLRAVT